MLYSEKFRNEILKKIKKPKLCTKKAEIFTSSYQETEGEPIVIRDAKAFHKVLNEMPIWIADWQIIVGGFASEPFAVPFSPEGSWRWVIEEIDTLETREGDKYEVTEETKRILKELVEYWRGKTIEDAVYGAMPEEVKEALESGIMTSGYITTRSGNFVLDFEKVIKKGLIEIENYIKQQMEKLDLTDSQDHEKWLYYKGALICCNAAVDFATRYALLAEELANKATDEKRKEELLRIAEVCKRVPKYPARNFHEALQAFWFIHALAHYETGATAGMSAGRMDQYLYPNYKKDIENGVITREEAERLIADYFINANQIMLAHDKNRASIFAGWPISEQPTLCGVTSDGKDATNELSMLILEVDKKLRLPQPDLTIMYHPGIKEEILEKACETLPLTMKPKFFNFNIAKTHVLAKGASEQDAKENLVNVGCVTSAIAGKSWGNNNMGFINLGKVLEVSINGGIDPGTGKKIGISTPKLDSLNTFSEFFEVFKKQLVHAIRMEVVLVNIVEKIHSVLSPQLFATLFIENHLEKGYPAWKGAAAYNIPGLEGVGFGNTVDSLAALKKIVFEEKIANGKEILSALKNNFNGYTELRNVLLENAPKFGNDDDYVDNIAKEVAQFFCEEVKQFKGPRGVPFYPALYSVSAHVGLGKYVGATSDGRRAGKPLSDGMSPAQGCCKNGPTAVINSVTKIDHTLATSGTLLNMKINASLFKTEEGRKKFIALLRAFMELGGYHAQFNIIDTEVLKDAQLHPEKYPGLLIRVAAYVAQFDHLPKDVQDDIITRSELGVD